MPFPHPCNLHRVARQCGVTLVDAADNRSTGRKPGLCACKPTAREIGQAHGEAHLALCFRLCTETGNGLEIHAATLQAISFLLRVEVMPVGSALFEAFDRIDLGHVRRLARAMPGSTANNMAALLWPMLAGTEMFRRAA